MCDTGFCDDDSAIGWAYHECDTCEPDPDAHRDIERDNWDAYDASEGRQ